MESGIILDSTRMFLEYMIPIVGILSMVLFLRPNFFADIEKKCAIKLGSRTLQRKQISLLEKENMFLQNALIRNYRIVGVFCFLLSVMIIFQLFR